MDGFDEGFHLRGITEKTVENVETVLDLAIVSHARRVSHPEAFALDDVESRLGCGVVDESDLLRRLVTGFGLPLVRSVALFLRLGHEDLLQLQNRLNLLGICHSTLVGNSLNIVPDL